MAEGIRLRHSRSCAGATGGRCGCTPSYEASVWSPRDGRKIRKAFPTQAAAKSWRRDTGKAVADHRVRAAGSTRFREAAEAWFADAASGVLRPRSGDRYKPSVLRSYRAALATERPFGHVGGKRSILDELGPRKLGEITRADLRRIAEDLIRLGLDGSTIRNAFMPVRAIFARAIDQEIVAMNPTADLRLPSPGGRRDRIATPTEATSLLDAVREADRALWGAAFYAGLRRGELAGLRWEDVDFERGVIRVLRSWDAYDGEVSTKSKAGRREVPIVGVLRGLLREHAMRSGRPSEGFVFAAASGKPFTFSAARRRALTDWKHASKRAVDEFEETLGREPQPEEVAAVTLAPIGLHEARHTFASLLIAAGVNIKAISTYMGHASVTITLDRYGHLMTGHEIEAVDKMDTYLDRTGAHTGAHPSSERAKTAPMQEVRAV